MPPADCTNQEVRLGEKIYERDIRAKLDPGHRVQFIVIHIESGDDAVDVTDRVVGWLHNGEVCLLRIGVPVNFNLYIPHISRRGEDFRDGDRHRAS